jgi:hypothetical protein
VDVTSLFAPAHASRPLQAINWEYKHLFDIEFIGESDQEFVRLIYEDDESGEMHTLLCGRQHYRHLGPYIADFRAWKSDPYAHENTVIPIALSPCGRAVFSLAGAEHDHPELARRNVNVKLHPEAAHQIRKAAKARGMTGAELVLTALLKSASKFG